MFYGGHWKYGNCVLGFRTFRTFDYQNPRIKIPAFPYRLRSRSSFDNFAEIKIKRKYFQVFIYHIKHLYFEEMENEIKKLHILKNGGKILEDGA